MEGHLIRVDQLARVCVKNHQYHHPVPPPAEFETETTPVRFTCLSAVAEFAVNMHSVAGATTNLPDICVRYVKLLTDTPHTCTDYVPKTVEMFHLTLPLQAICRYFLSTSIHCEQDRH